MYIHIYSINTYIYIIFYEYIYIILYKYIHRILYIFSYNRISFQTEKYFCEGLNNGNQIIR